MLWPTVDGPDLSVATRDHDPGAYVLAPRARKTPAGAPRSKNQAVTQHSPSRIASPVTDFPRIRFRSALTEQHENRSGSLGSAARSPSALPDETSIAQGAGLSGVCLIHVHLGSHSRGSIFSSLHVHRRRMAADSA